MKQFIVNLIAIKNAFLYSVSGLKYLLKERAFRQELGVGLILIVIEYFRSIPHIMLGYLFLSYVLILICESINSAIEAAIDRVGPEMHELSKKAKDIGSAAVFISMLHFGIIWIISWFF